MLAGGVKVPVKALLHNSQTLVANEGKVYKLWERHTSAVLGLSSFAVLVWSLVLLMDSKSRQARCLAVVARPSSCFYWSLSVQVEYVE